ncbi:hypothetical protein JCM10212_003185 [Sporobolomyces blumeae]
MSDSSTPAPSLSSIPFSALPPLSLSTTHSTSSNPTPDPTPAPLTSTSTAPPPAPSTATSTPKPTSIRIKALPPTSHPSPSTSSHSPAATPDEKPPPKKRRTKKAAGEVGPGKSWRKGLKGNLAGVGLDAATAAAIRDGTAKPASGANTHSGSSPVPRGSHAGTPSLASTTAALGQGERSHATSSTTGGGGGGGGRGERPTASSVGAPPKLQAQFLPAQVLEVGTPRPRRWNRTRKEFKSVTGNVIALSSWQGDPFSPYSEHVTNTSLDELASPPPPSSYPSLSRFGPGGSAGLQGILNGGGAGGGGGGGSNQNGGITRGLTAAATTAMPTTLRYEPPTIPTVTTMTTTTTTTTTTDVGRSSPARPGPTSNGGATAGTASAATDPSSALASNGGSTALAPPTY